MAKKIEPVNIWVGGEVKVAEWISLLSVNDNLETSATFYYNLSTNAKDEQDVDIVGDSLAVGNLTIDGQDYQDWGNQAGTDINTWAYDWAANKLNVVII
jgi:hypothetical protein